MTSVATSSHRAVLSVEECKHILATAQSMAKGGGSTSMSLHHRVSGTARWARGQVHTGFDTTYVGLTISRAINGAAASAETSRLDDAGLQEVVRTAERLLQFAPEQPDAHPRALLEAPMLEPDLWSDETLALDAEARGDLVRSIIAPVDAAGLYAAGELEIASEGHATLDSRGLVRYYPVTDVRYSISVRDKKGTASGWAGVNHYDITQIDPVALGQRALDKCQRMANPVGVEPGRYTTILEPQAVADLFSPLVASLGFNRFPAEGGVGPFAESPGQSKIGDLVLDRRLTLRSDPMDPDGGFVPFQLGSGHPYQQVNWIDHGVLRELAYDKMYGMPMLGKQQPLLNPRSYRLSSSAPAVPVEQMIETTKRGIYVTRFHDVRVVHEDSMLCTGYTRDGIWLIEDGRITKPIKNFRFNESPFFALNNVEAIGESVRVFSPRFACVVPPVKVKDFSFVGLADAV